MLKFFFNRFSKVVYSMEIIGYILLVPATFIFFRDATGLFQKAIFIITFILFAFIKYCATARFYTNRPHYSGIERQFKMSMVPTSYIFALTCFLLVVSDSVTVLIVSSILLVLIAHVNVIFLYLNFRDTEDFPALQKRTDTK